MRFFFFVFMICACGGWYLWNHNSAFKTYIENKIPSSEFSTLEIRYSPENIMEKYKKEFLKNENYTFTAPQLVFYPYLLLEIKFSKDNETTREGLLLFGLHDGEMVLNGSTWEKTHGFKGCLHAKASSEDFKILRPLIESGGILEKDKIIQKYKGQDISSWIESCKNKKLIIVNGSKIRLHFDNPVFTSTPLTNIHEKFVSHKAKASKKIPLCFSSSQIEKLAMAAFDQNLAILKTHEVYLPAYEIGIKNPDGSTLTTLWNALTGQRID